MENSNNCPAQNIAYGATIEASIVQMLIHGNLGIIFQQEMTNNGGGDAEINLIAYQQNAGSQQSFIRILINPDSSYFWNPGSTVAFANMALTADALKDIFKNEPITGIVIIPTGLYQHTNYISYEVSAIAAPGGKTPLDPSPPANGSGEWCDDENIGAARPHLKSAE